MKGMGKKPFFALKHQKKRRKKVQIEKKRAKNKLFNRYIVIIIKRV